MADHFQHTTQAWAFPFCPEPPNWTLDWDGIAAKFSWIRHLRGCPQNPIFHAEGDVFVHTRLVCEALVASPGWQNLDPEMRSVLFATALLHDAGKPERTRTEGGRITSTGHARLGASMARRFLWNYDTKNGFFAPLHIRELIASLVRFHGLPLQFLDMSDTRYSLIKASLTANNALLALFAEADVRGRICDDQSELLDRVALFRECALENQCWDMPRAFASDHSRFLYFEKSGRDPDRFAYDDTRFEVTLMSGLPASGKDHWLRTNRPDALVVSLDALRQEMKIGPEEEQAPIIARAKDIAQGWMRKERSFVWNATNVTRQMRQQLIEFFAAHGARIHIVYLEAPWDSIRRRNRARTSPVPDKILVKLVEKLDVPDLTEAHRVDWIEQTDLQTR